MFFANSCFVGKRFGDIRNEAKTKLFSGGFCIKTVFALMVCLVATVSAVMVGYMLLNVVDACGLLRNVPNVVWMCLEFSLYAAVGVLVGLPLACGWVRYLYVLTFDEDVSVIECFYYFNSVRTYARVLRFVLGFAVKLVFVIVTCEMTQLVQRYLVNYFGKQGYYIIGAAIAFFLGVLLILILVFVVFLMGRRFCSLAIFVRDDEISVLQIRRISKRASKGKMCMIFLYKLAYLPQIALTLITVLIYGGIYFAPLYTLAYFGAADELLSLDKVEFQT